MIFLPNVELKDYTFIMTDERKPFDQAVKK